MLTPSPPPAYSLNLAIVEKHHREPQELRGLDHGCPFVSFELF
jgi:hypothetical protein